jgi:hypothetical protein
MVNRKEFPLPHQAQLCFGQKPLISLTVIRVKKSFNVAFLPNRYSLVTKQAVHIVIPFGV